MKIKISLITLLLLIFCAFSFAQQTSGVVPRDGVIDKSEQLKKEPVQYPWVRKADYIWEKRVWRVIDMREKMNQVMYYPDKPLGNRDYNYRRSFFDVLRDAVKAEGVTAYTTDEFILPLQPKDIMGTLVDTVRTTYRKPTSPDIERDTMYINPVDTKEITKIRLKEDWFFDKQRSMLEVRILGICPIRSYLDPKGVPQTTALFWVYFPEIRPLLAQAEVFNRFNGAAKLTYDDFFWKRMFSSYIYKVDNQYDRFVNEYATGMDAILESERIKEDLFNFEQQLWEY